MPAFDSDIKRGAVVEHWGPTQQKTPFFDSNFEKLIQEGESSPCGLHGKKAKKEISKDALRQSKETYRYTESPRHYVKIKYLGQSKTTFNTVFEGQEGDILDKAQTLCQKEVHSLIFEMFDSKVPKGGGKGAGCAGRSNPLQKESLSSIIFCKKEGQ